jgi:hypothetical protein
LFLIFFQLFLENDENGRNGGERHELRDVSTGMMSRSTRSCFTSTACATGTTSAVDNNCGNNASTMLSVSVNGVNAITYATEEPVSLRRCPAADSKELLLFDNEEDFFYFSLLG